MKYLIVLFSIILLNWKHTTQTNSIIDKIDNLIGESDEEKSILQSEQDSEVKISKNNKKHNLNDDSSDMEDNEIPNSIKSLLNSSENYSNSKELKDAGDGDSDKKKDAESDEVNKKVEEVLSDFNKFTNTSKMKTNNQNIISNSQNNESLNPNNVKVLIG